MAQNGELLVVDGVTVERDGVEILHNVSLAVEEGEIHAVIGRNGSGKSTMAYTLMGSAGYVPKAGRVLFDGRDITHASMTERARLGITLAWQEPARFEGLTVGQYLKLGMREPSDDLACEALAAVALDCTLYINRRVDVGLSGGERKRIELAAVYAMQPRLAILDEPDSGVDVLSVQDVSQLLGTMREKGTTLLVITHRREVVQMADRASLICTGEILRTGRPEDVERYYVERCETCDVAEQVEEADDYERV